MSVLNEADEIHWGPIEVVSTLGTWTFAAGSKATVGHVVFANRVFTFSTTDKNGTVHAADEFTRYTTAMVKVGGVEYHATTVQMTHGAAKMHVIVDRHYTTALNAGDDVELSLEGVKSVDAVFWGDTQVWPIPPVLWGLYVARGMASAADGKLTVSLASQGPDPLGGAINWPRTPLPDGNKWIETVKSGQRVTITPVVGTGPAASHNPITVTVLKADPTHHRWFLSATDYALLNALPVGPEYLDPPTNSQYNPDAYKATDVELTQGPAPLFSGEVTRQGDEPQIGFGADPGEAGWADQEHVMDLNSTNGWTEHYLTPPTGDWWVRVTPKNGTPFTVHGVAADFKATSSNWRFSTTDKTPWAGWAVGLTARVEVWGEAPPDPDVPWTTPPLDITADWVWQHQHATDHAVLASGHAALYTKSLGSMHFYGLRISAVDKAGTDHHDVMLAHNKETFEVGIHVDGLSPADKTYTGESSTRGTVLGIVLTKQQYTEANTWLGRTDHDPATITIRPATNP